MDAKREEFRKYLEKEGVLEFLTKQLVKLYEETEKPENALDYLKNNVAENHAQVSSLKKMAELEKENLQLKETILKYEERIKILEQAGHLKIDAKDKSAMIVESSQPEPASYDNQGGKTLQEVTENEDSLSKEEDMEHDSESNAEGTIPITNDKERLLKEENEKMVLDAEQLKAEDDKQKERIAAKNSLESYCFNMKSTIEDEKFKDEIVDSDKEAITEKCDETIKWLDANQLAEVEEFQDKLKEAEGVCSPIVSKLDQQAGGAPDGMPGMPGGMSGEMPGECPEERPEERQEEPQGECQEECQEESPMDVLADQPSKE